MSFEPIHTGAVPNDGGGDTLRDAFEKANRNFARAAAALDRIEQLPPQRAPAPAHRHEEHVLRIVSDGAPDAAPPALGAMWVDADSGAIYLATGVDSVRDWRKLQLADA